VVAENGAVVLFENEGNIRMTTTVPPVHIALAGIDKILPTTKDLAALRKILPRSATGQKLSAYVSIIRGPRRDGAPDGPREFHLVLLDNGRSSMRDDPVLRDALKCIRCGACLNVCPVYQHIGGHAYGSVYPGPIGAMITESLAAGDRGWELPFASSLCGACEEACAAKIPITKILLELRRRAADAHSSPTERAAFRAWSEMWRRPAIYRATTGAAARATMLAWNAIASGGKPDQGMISKLPPPGDAWTRERDFPTPAGRTFHKRWPELSQEIGESGPGKSELKKSHAAGEALKSKVKSAPETMDMVNVLAEELRALGAKVESARCEADARDSLARALAAVGGGSLVRWDHADLDLLGLDGLGAAAGLEVVWPGGPSDDLIGIAASAAVGVTAVDFALADSGTLALITGPGRERSISLLPPIHLALVRASRILAGVDELIAAIDGQAGADDFAGLTLVTGPSRTADIELVPVIGVHGPKELVVVLWDDREQ